ncbi:MAG: response regulator [Rhodothermales bacterium]
MSVILIVEDELHLRENLGDLLELEGYTILSAENGQQGLDLALAHRPDLIISDVMMPLMSGHDMLAAIRAEEALATTPFIFLTALSEKHDFRSGMNLGADDYLTKPFNEDELLSAVEARLEKRALELQKREEAIDSLRGRLQKVLPHELRTPLVAILGYAQLLRDEWRDLADEEIDEMLTDIYHSGERLKTCSENYALYAQLQMVNGDPDTRRAFRDGSSTMVEGTLSQLGLAHALTQLRNDDLVVDVEEAEVAISQQYLFKLIDEILSNAFKFSQPGSPVRLTGRVVKGQYWITIQDAGKGMSHEQLNLLGAFMQFGREQNEQQGLGLGLTIAQMLASIYDGSIAYESAPGAGTTAMIRLPLVAHALSPA